MGSRTGRLSGAVHGDVIPRLLSAERIAERIAAGKSGDNKKLEKTMSWCTQERIQALTDECLKLADTGLYEKVSTYVLEHVSALLKANVPVEQIHVNLLAPMARELGNRWLRDEISFVDVHLGVVQLQSIVEKIDCVTPSHLESSGVNAAIAATPGDQHTFGASMATNLLSQRGWETTNLSGLDFKQWLTTVLSGRFNVVCLSLHSDDAFDTLCEAIKQLKNRWPSQFAMPIIIVAGDYFVRNPSHWKKSGADTVSTTIGETVQFVDSCLNESTTEQQTSSK